MKRQVRKREAGDRSEQVACACGEEACEDILASPRRDTITSALSELRKGIALDKCRKCGCMNDALDNLKSLVTSLGDGYVLDSLEIVESWLKQMQPIEYSCLGCKHCHGAIATNFLSEDDTLPEHLKPLSCGFLISKKSWPQVAGDYYVLCRDQDCPVAVSTLGSSELADKLAKIKPTGLCIVGKTETENIGIDKIIKNIISNHSIRYLIVAGTDPTGHFSGRTLLSLWENGVDRNMRVIGSSGRRPVLRNVTLEEVEAFRTQIEIVDMIGCESQEEVAERISRLATHISSSSSSEKWTEKQRSAIVPQPPIVRAEESTKIEMDKTGYLVIIPQPDRGIIIAEHYSYDNSLIGAAEGKDAKSICSAVVKKGWVSQLAHATYLGRELAKAELSMKLGFRYLQDHED